MKKIMAALASMALVAAPAAAMDQGHAAASTALAGELILYEMNGYNGDSWTIDSPSTAVHTDWNIHSIAVHPGDRWQICARPRFRDPCIILDRSVPDSSLIGIEGQIGSARPAPPPTPAPAPAN